MKKFFASVLIIAMLCSQAAFATKTEETNAQDIQPEAVGEVTETDYITECAEDTDEPAVMAEEAVPEKTELSISVNMMPKMKVVDSVAVLELCDAEGNVIGIHEEWIGGITKGFEFKCELPSIKAGDTYKLKLKSGLNYLKYYDNTYGADEEIELIAYGYTDENGVPCVAADFAFDACPMFEHAIVMYVSGKQLELYPDARLINGITMVPVEAVAEAMGLKVRFDERYNSFVCEVGDSQAIFNVGTSYATILGTDMYMPANCEIIDGTAFVPARTLAEAFGCTVEALDFGDHIDVIVGESPIIKAYWDSVPVNQWGISSRTNYMVWIDKSDFAVRVYKGSKGRWEQIKHFTCAIGAPGSPTITGSYEYQYRMPQWSYPGYYVGPCLVFHGNYAMHSTLLRYNGTPYDNRVGVMISHGCVRLRKADIDWLDRNLPLKSRIYITN